MTEARIHPGDIRPATSSGAGGYRPEIQGLRAVAVLAVLIYHLQPAALSGGYVGVDIFFVISGYLITGLLLREHERDGGISIARFYARRIKRLLPAATLTLLAVAVASFVLLPELYWADTAREILASAFYYQNWWLGYQAVDYLGADTSPSPTQHFWSLSVEEQYYIVWPWIMVAVAACVPARHFGRSIGVMLVLAFLGFLAYSILLTRTHPEFAYFATTTRAWELALGGLLAALVRAWYPPEWLRRVLGIVGMLAMLLAIVWFTRETPFPGYAALLPTVGAALVLLSGRTTGLGVYGMLSLAPMRFIGDISYSLYLWHWPLIIFFGHVADRPPGLVDAAGIFLASLLLAYLSKRFVEDPIHGSRLDPSALWRPYALAAACLLSSAIAAFVLLGWAAYRERPGAGAPDRAIGAAALKPGYRPGFVPSLAAARRDNPDVYALKCHGGFSDTVPRHCTFGAKNARHRIVLVGDSHAAQWLPALQELAPELSLQVLTFTKSSCPLTTAQVLKKTKGQLPYDECMAWNRALLRELMRTKPDLVIATLSSSTPVRLGQGEDRAEAMAKGLDDAWGRLLASGIRVLALRDTPRHRFKVPECVAEASARLADCASPRAKALRPEDEDPVAVAARRTPGVRYADLSDSICTATACDPVVGGVLVWRDNNHLTATYARSLAPALRPFLEATLEQRQNSN